MCPHMEYMCVSTWNTCVSAQDHTKSMQAIMGHYSTRLSLSLHQHTNPNAVANRTRRRRRLSLTLSLTGAAWYSLGIDRSIVVIVRQFSSAPTNRELHAEAPHPLMIGRNRHSTSVEQVHSFIRSYSEWHRNQFPPKAE